MPNSLKEIRLKMGYSVRGFAQLLGYKASTYQHYESGLRTVTSQVIADAKSAYQRDRAFFTKELPQRIAKVKPFMSEVSE